jgi:hypothetical protein
MPEMVFSRFLSMTIFIPAENTRHSEKPGQNSVCSTPFGKMWVSKSVFQAARNYFLERYYVIPATNVKLYLIG